MFFINPNELFFIMFPLVNIFGGLGDFYYYFKIKKSSLQERIEWANEAMAQLNTAYTTLMRYRFQYEKEELKPEERMQQQQPQYQKQKPKETGQKKQKAKKTKGSYYNPYDDIKYTIHEDIITKEFVKILQQMELVDCSTNRVLSTRFRT